MAELHPAPERFTRAQSKERTRRALLRAAAQVFVDRGYQGATLADIAAAAGHTKGAVYGHFRNKEALFVELLAEWIKRDQNEIDRIIGAADDAEQLEAELGRWLDRIDSDNQMPLLALELDLESRHNPSFAAILTVTAARTKERTIALLEHYFTAVGRDPPLALDELAMAMLMLFRSAALSRHTRKTSSYRAANVVRLLLGMPPQPPAPGKE